MEPDLDGTGEETVDPPIDTQTTERTIQKPATTPGWGSNFGESTTEPPSILAPVIQQK